MATLKTTLKIESTDLFPTPVNFTQVNNNTIGGAFSGFNTVQVALAASTTILNLGTINPSAYVYLRAASTNVDTIEIFAGAQAYISLSAGDVAFFPYGDGTGAAPDIEASSGTASQVLDYFIGEKS